MLARDLDLWDLSVVRAVLRPKREAGESDPSGPPDTSQADEKRMRSGRSRRLRRACLPKAVHTGILLLHMLDGRSEDRDVVVLYYQPDETVVEPMIDRLKAEGLPLWDHKHEMAAGTAVGPEIRERIRTATLVLLCASDAAAERDWFGFEAAWAQAFLHERPAALMLLRVGEFDPEGIPDPLSLDGRNSFDLTIGHFEERCGKLADDLFARLDLRRPVVVTGVVAAMTRDQFDQILDDGAPDSLSQVMRGSGVRSDQLTSCMRERYGDSAYDFCPFGAPDHGPRETVPELVSRLLPEINKQRHEEDTAEVVVRWVNDDASSDEGRQFWEMGDSLIVVDGASLLDESVKSMVEQLPDPDEKNRCALVWIPPFTQHTAEGVSRLESLMGLNRVKDPFRNWLEGRHLSQGRALGFDFSVPAALTDWMFRTLSQIEGGEADQLVLRRLQGERSLDLPGFGGRR